MTKQISKTAAEMRRWNKLGKTPSFTKEEHSRAFGGNSAYERLAWNLDGCRPKYTKKEHESVAKYAWERRIWNRSGGPDQEKYTKEEHSEAPYFDAYEARWWNSENNEPKYTKEEHSKARDCTVHEKFAWNFENPNSKYTEEELS